MEASDACTATTTMKKPVSSLKCRTLHWNKKNRKTSENNLIFFSLVNKQMAVSEMIFFCVAIRLNLVWFLWKSQCARYKTTSKRQRMSAKEWTIVIEIFENLSWLCRIFLFFILVHHSRKSRYMWLLFQFIQAKSTKKFWLQNGLKKQCTKKII